MLKESDYRVVDTLQDGTIIKQINYEDLYIQESKLPNSSLINLKYFYANTGNLKMSGTKFCGLEIGIWKKYDENGNLISERNFDEHYPFSVQDLSLMLNNKFNINLMQKDQQIGVIRGFEGLYYYDIYYSLSPGSRSDYRLIRINGISGDVISDTIKSRDK